jgi:hypothetical protein
MTAVIKASIGRPRLRAALIFVILLLGCFGLLHQAKAVSPAPDGGYPGGNTAEGQNALLSLTTGGFNTAVGWLSLRNDTTGQFNTAVGAGTLFANTGDSNTAVGSGALLNNTTGLQNTANGAFALFSNTEGNVNTATGDQALFSNTTGGGNTANGIFALYNNTSGNRNTAIGGNALSSNATGNANTAIGNNALQNNTGDFNIALGQFAGSNLTTGSHNIDIGNSGFAAESNTIRIGIVGIQTATVIAGISGVPVAGTGVVVDANGQLGVAASSRRFKDEIKSMDKTSEAILELKPVTFRYKHEIDPKRIPQFGLVAEEVQKVNPDLVACDAKGEPYTVRYEAINAMLLNEFLKEHRKVEKQAYKMDAADRKIQKQEATIAELKSGMKALAATINEQTLKLQKASARIDLNRPAPQQVVLKIP